VSVVCYGTAVHFALKAAEQAEAEGISVEVFDLRSLNPLDAGGV
jgi:pyruvate/2-oxoglutarate/acetoin dehydrogenase E1 component